MLIAPHSVPLERSHMSEWQSTWHLSLQRSLSFKCSSTHRQSSVRRDCNVADRQPALLGGKCSHSSVLLELLWIQEEGDRADVSLFLTFGEFCDVFVLVGWLSRLLVEGEVCEDLRGSFAEN